MTRRGAQKLNTALFARCHGASRWVLLIASPLPPYACRSMGRGRRHLLTGWAKGEGVSTLALSPAPQDSQTQSALHMHLSWQRDSTHDVVWRRGAEICCLAWTRPRLSLRISSPWTAHIPHTRIDSNGRSGSNHLLTVTDRHGGIHPRIVVSEERSSGLDEQSDHCIEFAPMDRMHGTNAQCTCMHELGAFVSRGKSHLFSSSAR